MIDDDEAGAWLPFVAGLSLAGASIVGLDPDGWFPFSVAKWWLVVVAVLGLASASSWSGDGGSSEALGRSRVGCVHVLMLALIGVTTLSGFTALDDWSAWVGTPVRHLGVATWWLFAVALFAGSALASRGGASRQVQSGAVTAGVVLAAYSLRELSFGRPIEIDVDSSRLGGSYGSPAYLGAMCCLLVPLGVGLAVDRGSTMWRRVGAGFVGAGLIVATVGSGSRAALLGLVVAAFVVVVLRQQSIRGLGLTGVVVAVGAAVVSVAVVLRRGVFERSAGVGTRLDEWRLALRAVAERPLLGAGPEGYRVSAFELVDDDYVRRFGERTMVDRAHSGLLDVAVASGVVAALLYAALLIAVGAVAVGLIRRGQATDVGLGAGLLAFAVGQQFLFPIAEIDPLFWLLVGVAVVRVGVVTVDAEGMVGSDGSGSSRDGGSTTRRVIAVGFGVGALFAAVVGVRAVAADRLAHQAVTATDPEVAYERATQAADLAQRDTRHRLLAAQVSAARGSLAGVDDALVAVDRAIEISPRDPAVRIERARLLALRAAITGTDSDRSAAERAWADLVADAPSCARCHRGAGLAAAERGDFDAAEASLERARELGDSEAARLMSQSES